MQSIDELYSKDEAFIKRYEAFAFDEVVNEDGQTLEDKDRYLAILATLMGCQGLDYYKVMLSQALEGALTPIEVKEMVYQGVDYLGMGRVYPFLHATNEVMEKKKIALPLADQTTTTMDNRLEKGSEAQVAIFGENMKDFWKGGHMNRWLAANCFGDYYTRDGLSLAYREMITFCFLLAQGGCESQLGSHIFGNINVGNSTNYLTSVVSQCVPYIGYPRSLNAMTMIRQAAEKMQG